MQEFNFNNKTFSLVENSAKGQVNTDTSFKYKQDGNLVTADYYGGSVRYGKIIGHLKKDKLIMLYQCITNKDELKAGKATATISLNKENKIRLTLNWEWLNNNKETGVSEYIEN
ncbi:hypothetical protein N1F78_08985 [Seonamhaeicola sp. MEBiC1930]|uniref:hypothetical protein n=1 Tax=Seonamhaeicola sp. MEBiC01930 TaxID=2976768 RepID=UPI00324EF29A